MAQKLNVKAFALASALLGGFVYIVCAILSWISPEFMISLGNYLVHSIDLAKITRTSITLSSTVLGFILITILSYVIGGLFAWIYNNLLK